MEPRLFRYIWTHSRREQLLILAVILISLPFYWVSLDIPKRIVNDAIQGKAFKDGKATAKAFELAVSLPDYLGGGTWRIFDGVQVGQLNLVLSLSFVFLAFVLVNGYFKYVINLRKGVLAERMLRRLRYDLFSLMLRFRPEDIRGVKPAEAASIIKDEVEPIGAFIGDAYIQPAFLGLQAFTALLFIVMQNIWLGILTVFFLGIQGVVIPSLRREQLRLGRIRQITSRQLAGRIGEIVETAPSAFIHGITDYHRAEIGGRLARLFGIRLDLYKRKFAVKYLNNLLAQMTPFFFYAIGGYFALQGQLDIGQLVAVIAAYRDLPTPIKELIDWDQNRADAMIKYEQVVSQFAGKKLTKLIEADAAPALPAPDAPILIDNLRVRDGHGGVVLDNFSAEIARPSHLAVVGQAGSGRDALVRTLGRQISDVEGTVKIGGLDLVHMASDTAGRFMAYAGPETYLFPASIRDNIAVSLKRAVPMLDATDVSDEEAARRMEALSTGNPLATDTADWIDYSAAGLTSPAELDGAIIGVLKVAGLDADIYRMGLLRPFDSARDPAMAAQLIEARKAVHEGLMARAMTGLVEPFNPDKFNPSSSLGDNLLFGETAGERPASLTLMEDSYFRSILEAESLVDPLLAIGIKIATTTIELFADLPPNHPLFERFSFIRADQMDMFRELIEGINMRGTSAGLASADVNRLVALSLGYIEPRHRLNLIDAPLRERILRARRSLREHLPAAYSGRIEFYDPARLMKSMSVRDNLLFGRVQFGIANAEAKVEALLQATLAQLGLDTKIFGLGLETDAGLGGRSLLAHQRAGINLARCLIKRPDLFILDGAFTAYSPSEGRAILARVRAHFMGRTLIVSLGDPAEAEGYDRAITFDGARAGADNASALAEGLAAAAVPADAPAALERARA